MPASFFALFAVAWPVVAGWLALKLFPGLITRFLEKQIDERANARLERLKSDLARETGERLERTKSELSATYATLRTSVDLLAASNSGMRPHTIAAVESFWAAMVKMRSLFGDLAVFDTTFLKDEIEKAFAGDPQLVRILGYVAAHQGKELTDPRRDEFFEWGIEKGRLFCGEQLWLIFYVTRAVYARTSMKIALSFKDKVYQSWRDDEATAKLLEAVLPRTLIDHARKTQFEGLHMILNQLEGAFLQEAAQVLSGQKAISDGLANMQTVMKLETAKLAAQGIVAPPLEQQTT